jgi:hypothetical protein
VPGILIEPELDEYLQQLTAERCIAGWLLSHELVCSVVLLQLLNGHEEL